MLTVDDCNSILEKYKDCLWSHDYDLSVIGTEVGTTYEDDYAVLTINVESGTPTIRIRPKTNLFYSGYILNHSGEISNKTIYYTGESFKIVVTGIIPSDWIIRMYCTTFKVDYSEYDYASIIFVPVSSLRKTVINAEFDNKLYIEEIVPPMYAYYFIDDVEIEKGTDEKGTYLILPSAEDCLIIPKYMGDTTLPFKVTFQEFKELPIPYIPTLYRGTPQNVQVLNSEDDDPISDYQTYYQGRLLKDNIIHLPYDSEDYVNISVDLKDYRYPFVTVKLKAPTVIYQANSQSDVETAIENGIQTLQVGDNQTEVTLNSIELSNVTLINSNIQVSESILTDCQIIDSTYTDNGGNNITNTIFKDTDYNNTAQSNYNEVTFNECNIHDSEINLTGTITKSTITDTLILSDGVINIQDNTFTGVGLKEYFPSHLYLTGDYTVTGNIFNLTGEWEELQYNMCLIKATSNFNPSEFINKNTFNLNITYEDEPTNTFYYNIVDDDKIRAVRLQ